MDETSNYVFLVLVQMLKKKKIYRVLVLYFLFIKLGCLLG